MSNAADDLRERNELNELPPKLQMPYEQPFGAEKPIEEYRAEAVTQRDRIRELEDELAAEKVFCDCAGGRPGAACFDRCSGLRDVEARACRAEARAEKAEAELAECLRLHQIAVDLIASAMRGPETCAEYDMDVPMPSWERKAAMVIERIVAELVNCEIRAKDCAAVAREQTDLYFQEMADVRRLTQTLRKCNQRIRELEAAKEALTLGMAEQTRRAEKAEAEFAWGAPLVDLLNSWAREYRVPEAQGLKDARGVIDGLWAKASTERAELAQRTIALQFKARAEKAEAELAKYKQALRIVDEEEAAESFDQGQFGAGA